MSRCSWWAASYPLLSRSGLVDYFDLLECFSSVISISPPGQLLFTEGREWIMFSFLFGGGGVLLPDVSHLTLRLTESPQSNHGDECHYECPVLTIHWEPSISSTYFVPPTELQVQPSLSGASMAQSSPVTPGAFSLPTLSLCLEDSDSDMTVDLGAVSLVDVVGDNSVGADFSNDAMLAAHEDVIVIDSDSN